jgi:fluoroquinolone transport system permease protein
VKSAAVRLASCIANDVRLQLRHGLYTVYAALSVLYILLLRGVPVDTREALLPVLVFLDPAMAGFFFVGGVVLLERNDRVLAALFTSPMRLGEYLCSKVISLTALGLAASLAVSVGAAGLRFKPGWIVVGVVLTSAVFTIVGLGAAARFRTLNKYMVWSAVYMLPFAIPVAATLAGIRSPLLYLLPSQGSLALIAAAFQQQGPAAATVAASIATLCAWMALGWVLARRWFRTHVIERVGGEG